MIVQDIAPVFRKTKPKLIVYNSLRMENKLLSTNHSTGFPGSREGNMRNRIAILGLFVVLLLAVQSAFANSVNYFTSGTYLNQPPSSTGIGTPTTPLTAPGNTFSFSFSVPLPVSLSASDPLTCSPDCFTTILPISYSSGSFSGTVPGTAVVFFNALSGGGLDINFTLGGNSYLFEFFGAPAYFNGSTSNPTLLTGSLFYGGLSFGFNGSLGDIVNTNGTITATTTTVPEPGSLTLLGTGAVAIAGTMRRKLLSRIRA
jgi:PEP-CTERM motif